ncbi:hypothetical protein FD845_25885, partial [Escherichia coli]|nr:hypothetical protein [Escherichia coli]
ATASAGFLNGVTSLHVNDNHYHQILTCHFLLNKLILYMYGSSPIMVGRLRTPYSAYRSGTSLPV